MAKGKSALAMALKKKIGSNDEIQKVSHWIDSGFPPLNKAISGRYDGGFPSGRIVEIFGPPSAGKCVTADTMLLTERGMVTVRELFEIEGHKATCTTRDVEHNVGLINENGVIEKTSHLTWNNRRKFKRIKLASGGCIEATFRHPIRAVDDLGNIVWRHAEKISVGDTIPSMVGTHQFGDQHLDADIAKLMGYLIADGYVASENSVNFSNTDPFIKDEFYRLISLVSDKMPVTRKHNGSEDHVLFSKEVRSLLFKEYGLDYEKAAGKQVPLTVRRANSEAQIAFLRGYFELECHVNDGRSIEVVSASGLLLQQIRLMLLNLGIASTISEKHVAGYKNTYYRLSFSGSNYDLFLSMIGFESPARLAVATKRDISFDRTYSGYVPHISGLVKSLYESLTKTSREDYVMVDHVIDRGDRVGIDKLREIYAAFIGRKNRFNEHLFAQLAAAIDSNLFFDEVVAIEEGEAPTFDVAMPETHSFWSNGIISHNTFLATAAMVSAQKQEGLAVFLDHENSFDVGLAVANGLNADEDDGQWVYKQPDTFEESVELIGTILKLVRDEELIPADAPICIVADSLASMVPNSKAEKFDKMAEGTAKDKDQLNMNDNTALARATSANFPTLALWARKYNACLIFLNQMRTNLGIMFGDRCLRGDAIIPFVDGTSATIREIVENKIEKDVWSYNEESGVIEPKKINEWHDNGCKPDDEKWIHISTLGHNTKNGVMAATFTEDHRILTRRGWTTAKDIIEGDELLTKRTTVLTNETKSQVVGFLVGDCAFRKMRGERTTAGIAFQDNANPSYSKWKADKLSNLFGEFTETKVLLGRMSGKYRIRHDSPVNNDFKDLEDYVRNPLKVFTEFASWQNFALLVMDDGHLDSRGRYDISFKRKAKKHCGRGYLENLADILYDKFSIRSKVNARKGGLLFDQESSAIIAENIASFVFDSMQYKLPSEYRGKFVDNYDMQPVVSFYEHWTVVKDVRESKVKKGAGRTLTRRYDIGVEDNHNYMVGNSANGFIVHNCTSPGGDSPKFYASVRIRLGASVMKDGKDKIGQDVGAECIKNKVAPPFGKCSWKFYFDPTRGLDVIESLVEHMLEEGYLPKNASGRVEIGDKKYTKSQIVDMYRDKPLPEIIAALQAIDERRTKESASAETEKA